MDPPYDVVEQLEPGIARLLAHNPSAFTFTGTQSYLVGTSEVAIIDPGPDDTSHVDSLVEGIAGRPVAAIVCTHTHRDHSPASASLARRTGAPIIGCAPLALQSLGPRADASFDRSYSADRILDDGESISIDGNPLTAIATPGHTSNHLCFAWGDVLFTGDHVMGWSTTVVIPPDGDMAAYLESLEKLRLRDDRIYYPAHGPAVTKPQRYVRSLIGHRMQREKQILRLVSEHSRDIPDIVAMAYPGLDRRLTGAAAASVYAHLLDLRRRRLVVEDGDLWTAGTTSDSRS